MRNDTPAKSPKRKFLWLLLIRRIHLYSGLALLPWVCIYGFSALLFNHPTWLSDRSVSSLDAADFGSSAFTSLAAPEDLAKTVLQAVRDKLAEEPEDPYSFGAPGLKSARIATPAPPTLSAPEEAHFRGQIRLDVKRPGARDSILFDPTGPAATRYTTPARTKTAPVRDPFQDVSNLDVELVDSDALMADLPGILKAAGMEGGEVSLRGLPDLRFEFLVDGELWHGNYDLERSRFSAEPADEVFDRYAARNLFKRLHKTSVRPPTRDSRWLWATFVDALGVLLLFWSGSGLAMWWQLRRARKPGLIILAITLGIAIPLVLALASN